MTIEVIVTDSPDVIIQSVGQQGVPGGTIGEPGSPGPSGQPRWSGYGPPPTVIVGAQPGDVYIDLSNGDLWDLE